MLTHLLRQLYSAGRPWHWPSHFSRYIWMIIMISSSGRDHNPHLLCATQRFFFQGCRGNTSFYGSFKKAPGSSLSSCPEEKRRALFFNCGKWVLLYATGVRINTLFSSSGDDAIFIYSTQWWVGRKNNKTDNDSWLDWIVKKDLLLLSQYRVEALKYIRLEALTEVIHPTGQRAPARTFYYSRSLVAETWRTENNNH